jgi:hypothetical protein
MIGFTACTSSSRLTNGSRETDDIYYTAKDAHSDRQAAAKIQAEEEARLKKESEAQQLAHQTEQARSKPGSNYYDEPFDYDDYYDYEYAARLRRFQRPLAGYGYYNNYYTNSYFYNNNPYYFGSSIYNGYSFWGPSYTMYSYNPSSFWYWNSGWNWGTGCGSVSPVMFNNPGMGWGYSPYNPHLGWNQPWEPSWGANSYWGGGWNQPWGTWYDPWGGWGYYNDPYMMGYQNGFWNGMNNNSFNNYYFNSFDDNSIYYGPRLSTTGSGSRGESVQNGTLGERFMRQVATDNEQPTMSRNDVNQRTVYAYNNPSAVQAAPANQSNRTVNEQPVQAGQNTSNVPARPAAADRNPQDTPPSPTFGRNPNTPAQKGDPKVSPNASPAPEPAQRQNQNRRNDAQQQNAPAERSRSRNNDATPAPRNEVNDSGASPSNSGSSTPSRRPR